MNKTEVFIEKAKKVHGDLYNYDSVTYITNRVPVIIVCSVHGPFNQKPVNHLQNKGCAKCKGGVKSSKDDFIKKAKEIHGEKFDYSLVEYINSHTKITILCSVHGPFEQKPYCHLDGDGCAKCYGNDLKTTDFFIEKAKEIHGNRYDYLLAEYSGMVNLIKIVCKKHGVFEQNAGNHLTGSGCPYCCEENRRLSQDDFIEKAKQVHGDRFDYSLVVYETSKTKIKIVCKKHGVFEQSPHGHLKGRGCKKCVHHIKENLWLDSFNISEEFRQYKIDRMTVDGYDETSNTVYEFYGDFWHGNPNRYDKTTINNVVKKTFGDLYENTMKREQKLKSLGYNVVTIWETDWDILQKEKLNVG